jgi:hypothetical protein
MINYIEKGPGLFDAIAAAGHVLYQRDNQWITGDPVAVQAIIDTFDPTPPVPASVTARQARLALFGAGLLDLVEGAVAAMEGPQGRAVQIEWEYALAVERQSPLIAALAPALGLTDEQVDNLFRAAENL